MNIITCDGHLTSFSSAKVSYIKTYITRDCSSLIVQDRAPRYEHKDTTILWFKIQLLKVMKSGETCVVAVTAPVANKVEICQNDRH